MKVTLESTTQIVECAAGDGAIFHARVWEGTTEHGVKVQALIPRIAAHKDSDCSQFEAELKEQRPPSVDFQAFPLRMVL